MLRCFFLGHKEKTVSSTLHTDEQHGIDFQDEIRVCIRCYRARIVRVLDYAHEWEPDEKASRDLTTAIKHRIANGYDDYKLKEKTA
jgi:hypothetical protein